MGCRGTLAQQRQSPKQQVAGKGDRGVRHEVVRVDRPAGIGEADFRHDLIDDDAVGAIGETDPALAPLAIMIAIRNGGIPNRPAAAMPSGAISAVAARCCQARSTTAPP
jgi:hypothetical protein